VNSNWDDAADKRTLGAEPRGSGRLIGLFFILAVVMLVVWGVRQLSPPTDPTGLPAVGKRFDDLHFEPLIGDAQPITTDSLQGQVTLVNFWGPWCGPCRAEFPELMELRKDLQQNDKFRFVSVSCSADGNDAQLEAQTNTFLKQQGAKLPVHRDPKLVSANALAELNKDQGFAFPTTVLLDQQGTIRSLWIGYHPDIAKEMRKQIDALLKQP
jgi:thiol-disulfide isomerase/thioredoxin